MWILRTAATVDFPVCLPQHRILRVWVEVITSCCQASGSRSTLRANSTASSGTSVVDLVETVSLTRRISLTNAKLTLQLLKLCPHIRLVEAAFDLDGAELDVLQGDDCM